MKTQKEIEIIKDTYETASILCDLFSKYKDYDSSLAEHYDPSVLFARKANKDSTDNVEKTENIALVEYKESIFKKIINKIKNIFKK